MNTSLEESYSLAGEAIGVAQMFELSFMLAAKLILDAESARSVTSGSPIRLSTAAKQATTAILKELRKTSSLNADLDDRISNFVEKRHRIVHRAVIEHGWPQVGHATPQFMDLCREVIAEGNELTKLMVDALVLWADEFDPTHTHMQEHMKRDGVTRDDLVGALARLKST